jgi:hypothetical protein
MTKIRCSERTLIISQVPETPKLKALKVEWLANYFFLRTSFARRWRWSAGRGKTGWRSSYGRFGSEADVRRVERHVRFVPTADVSNVTPQMWG